MKRQLPPSPISENAMLLIHCPYCGEERPEIEFRHGGEAHIARPEQIAEISDEAFEAFLFFRENSKGIVFERWRHVHGCARFFNAVRHSVSDRFIMTYKAGEPRPQLNEAQIAAAAPIPSEMPANLPIGSGKTGRKGDEE